MPEAYAPGFTLVDCPAAHEKDLVQLLVHDALRRHPGKVLVYDSSHAFHPDDFAAVNRKAGRPEAEFAERCLVQRCITPFQWDTLLSKHLDRFVAANAGNIALIVAFPFGRLFATDELAEWERIDHLDFCLDHLPKRATESKVPIVAVLDLSSLADQPPLQSRMRAVPGLLRARRDKGVWSLQGPAGNVHLALSKPQIPGWDGLHPMGMSQPTVSAQIDAFQASFSAFRTNLPRREQARFDDLVTWARRHGNALNVSEDLDTIRRILLVAAIALGDRQVMQSEAHAELEARHRQLTSQVESRLRAVEAALGIASPTVPPAPASSRAVPASSHVATAAPLAVTSASSPEPQHAIVPLRRLPQRQLEHHGGLGQVADGHVPVAGPVPA